MTLTRANLESLLVKRCGGLMSLVDMAVTTAGANADLNDPLQYALRYGEYEVADITSVSNSDIAEVEDADIDLILDVAELRLLENIQGNFNLVDITNGPESEKYSQAANVIEKRLSRLQDKVDSYYPAPSTYAMLSVPVGRTDAYNADE
mgnify:FL=1|jgi:hypothetical protein